MLFVKDGLLTREKRENVESALPHIFDDNLTRKLGRLLVVLKNEVKRRILKTKGLKSCI